MKRANESSQQSVTQPNESNKKPRYSQSNYGDVYAQYGMMSQYNQANPFGQNAGNAGYGGYSQPTGSIYNMGYGAQSMMASQYGTGYPQAFPNAAPAYGAQQPGMLNTGEASRTVYLGNMTKAITPHDVLKCVRTGLVESYRTCLEKNCAFLAFVDPTSAQAFFQEYLIKKLIIKEVDIKLGWGKTNTIPNTLKLQIQGGATRNVYLGRLTDKDTEETIRAALSKYGPIEHIKLIRDKNIAFVHFLSIGAAVKCVGALIQETDWRDKRINYGKDHCSVNPTEYNAFGGGFQYGQPFDPYSGYQPATNNGRSVNSANVLRTLYFGNVHPDAKTEDICNVIRGGNLLQIRYFPEKHIAFVTFMDASTALSVYSHAQNVGLVVRGRRLRAGWGKPSSISGPVSQAIQQGATRNIYIGGIPDTFTEEQLKKDFSEFGEIELVNAFREKKCAFVNFTNVGNAVNAITAMKLEPEYADFKLNFGKDRCGNAFKPVAANKGKKDGENKDEPKQIEAGEANNEGEAAGVAKEGDAVADVPPPTGDCAVANQENNSIKSKKEE